MKLSAIAAPLFFALCAIPATFACGGGGGGETQTATNPSATPSATGSEAPMPSAWKDMNHDQRAVYMKRVVMPKMKADFAAFDAKKWGDVNCMTCHGDGAKDGSFKMPNPGLPKLPATPDGFKKLAADKPEVFKFMVGVEHTVAGLIQEEPYSPQNTSGFGCLNCHTHE